jgi:hypothetical protein
MGKKRVRVYGRIWESDIPNNIDVEFEPDPEPEDWKRSISIAAPRIHILYLTSYVPGQCEMGIQCKEDEHGGVEPNHLSSRAAEQY